MKHFFCISIYVSTQTWLAATLPRRALRAFRLTRHTAELGMMHLIVNPAIWSLQKNLQISGILKLQVIPERLLIFVGMFLELW